MKKVFIVSVLVGLMAGAAFGEPNYKMVVRDSATLLNTIDLPGGGSVMVDILIDNQGDTTGGLAYGGAQARLLADKPGVSYGAATSEGTSMTNYVSPWTQDVFSTALWAGWFEADPGDPASPLQDWDNDGALVPIPGGPLPTPLLGSSRGGSKGDGIFAQVVLNVAGPVTDPITVYLDATPGTGSLLFTTTGGPVPVGGYIPFVITPEPISALLLLAGLPMLRRRR